MRTFTSAPWPQPPRSSRARPASVHNTMCRRRAGPSETALSLTMTVTPDAISQDGASQSADRRAGVRRGWEAGTWAGCPARHGREWRRRRFRVVVRAFSRDRHRWQGIAVYTAPPPPSAGGLGTTVTIVGTPTGTNAGGTNFFATQIRLTPVGSVPPPRVGHRACLAERELHGLAVSAGRRRQRLLQRRDSTAAAVTPSSYTWDFGDGDTASGVTRDHAFRRPGPTTCQLTVTDDAGQSRRRRPASSVSGRRRRPRRTSRRRRRCRSSARRSCSTPRRRPAAGPARAARVISARGVDARRLPDHELGWTFVRRRERHRSATLHAYAGAVQQPGVVDGDGQRRQDGHRDAGRHRPIARVSDNPAHRKPSTTGPAGPVVDCVCATRRRVPARGTAAGSGRHVSGPASRFTPPITQRA